MLGISFRISRGRGETVRGRRGCCVLVAAMASSTIFGSLAIKGSAPTWWRSCRVASKTRWSVPLRSVRCSAVVKSDGEVLQESSLADSSSAWRSFVNRVSGEWDGHGADFSSTGEPLNLPYSVVPEAFQEWGVEVKDWQTMCPSLAHEDSKSFGYKVTRLLPTVGCEADAATPYSSEDRSIESTLRFSFHVNGSYIAVWPGSGETKESQQYSKTGKNVVRNTNLEHEWEVEHCLVKEGAARSRVRLLQQFVNRDSGSQGLLPFLKSVTVYVEQWEGPFRNGESLGGCSTSGSGFALTSRLQSSALAGSWHVDDFVPEIAADGSPGQLTAGGSRLIERLEAGVIFLPKNLWCSGEVSARGDSFIAEAGWLFQPDKCIVSTCERSPVGDLKVAIRFEQRTS